MTKPSDFLPRRGRPPKSPITFEIVRELTDEDIMSLAQGDRPSIAPPMIQKLSEIHRKIARMLAYGHPDQEIALVVGRTPQRIRDLKADPSMQRLVAYFASQREDLDISAEAQMRVDLIEIAEITTGEIRDRLESPEKRALLPMSELRKLNEMALDRTVAPPKGTVNATPPPIEITFKMPRPTETQRPTPPTIDLTPDEKS